MAATLLRRASVDFLAVCRAAGRADLLDRAGRLSLPAGSVAEYPRDRLDAHIIESGVIRAFQVAEDGRESTIGYLHGGEYLGALPALEPIPMVYIQPLVATTLLRLDTNLMHRLFDDDAIFGRAVAVHTGTILARVVRVVTVRTLGSVVQRLAFDLLERATADQLGSDDLVFNVTHEELARSIGSAREVVSRALGDLRQAGIVSTGHGSVRVEDVVRLTDVVYGLVA